MASGAYCRGARQGNTSRDALRFEQLPRRHAQRPRQPTHVPDAQVPLAALDLTHHGEVKSRLMGQFLLAPLPREPQAPNVFTHDDLAVDGPTGWRWWRLAVGSFADAATHLRTLNVRCFYV
jgi:hypothetical protein